MNVRALVIATCVGATFFAAGYAWNYQPDVINADEIWSMLESEHGKARAAVSRVLIASNSAHFNGLRTVEADQARYVCGSVKAMDKERQYVETAFVYTVAIDFARIDDDGRITSQRSAYKPCPTAADDKIADQKTLISPGALSMIKTVEKIIPKSSGGTMEQQLGQLAGQTAAVAPSSAVAPRSAASSGSAVSAGTGWAPAAQHSSSAVEAPQRDELTWRVDQPPAAWPTFPSGHALAKSTQKRTSAEALAFARDIEARWEEAKSSGIPTKRPSPEEIKEACRALLAIDPTDKEYPRAWAAFVRLRKIDRDAAA
ncbi:MULTISPECIES: hypothetical protein [unclassified Bradyrhizobium]|uniref:hypothetical protein n=1 Tax=unclassified Bradyrhizobium TaxID=2631580 RepID=UPI001FFC1272|nr:MULTISPECIES: hypothetical protein [unclassified Bradyrhizobium]MCK1709469.1 hypothetical protein [Bradyrhizobium sp. 143]MCK1729138.1 hypothetical protein [Bradyrhizobium sp. 142]